MIVRLAAIGLAFAATPLLAAPAETLLAMADVTGPQGLSGTARIIDDKGHAVLLVDLTGVAPGVHGIHLHTVGACAAADFTDAGGHLNPGGHKHGTQNPAGSHLGDLPNVTAKSDGAIHASLELPMSAEDVAGKVFDADGTALVLHAGPDDYRTDPAGGSGARIACGVFRKPA